MKNGRKNQPWKLMLCKITVITCPNEAWNYVFMQQKIQLWMQRLDLNWVISTAFCIWDDTMRSFFANSSKFTLQNFKFVFEPELYLCQEKTYDLSVWRCPQRVKVWELSYKHCNEQLANPSNILLFCPVLLQGFS